MIISEHSPRRVGAGLCLITGPGLMLAGWAIFPSVADSNTEWVSDIATDTTRAAAGMALILVGMAVSILAYMALVHLVREREQLAGDIGGALAIVGAALSTGVFGLVLAEVEAIRQLGDSADTATVIEAIDDSAAVVPLWMGTIVWAVGLVVLAGGLARAHTTPLPFAALLGAGAVTQWLGLFVFSNLPVLIVGFGLIFVALASIGWQVWTETDEEWEHAPVFDGFHRVSAA